MRRTPRKMKTIAVALTDPQPNFVSLVKAGANMTPFKAVRAAVEVEGDDEMKVTRSSDHGIASFTFSKEVFKTEAEVKAWLDAGGYEDYEIVSKDDAFFVAGEEGLSEEVQLVEKDGVTTAVAPRAVETEKDAEVEAVEATEAASSVVVTVKEEAEVEAVADASEGASEPEAVEPVETAKSDEEVNPVANSIERLVAKGMKQPEVREKDTFTMSWLGDLASNVASLYYNADYLGIDEGAAASLKIAGMALLDAFATVSDETVAELGAMFAAEDAEDAATKSEEPVAETEAEEIPAEEAPAEEAPVDEISALKAQVDNLTKMVEKLAKAEAEPEEPEQSLDEVRQTRKSADVEVIATEAEDTNKKSDDERWLENRRVRSTIGI
jgi:hypothetical protein